MMNPFRKKPATSPGIDAAARHLAEVRAREIDVVYVIEKVDRVVRKNHLGPQILDGLAARRAR